MLTAYKVIRRIFWYGMDMGIVLGLGAPKPAALPVRPFLIYYGWIPHRPSQFDHLAETMVQYPVVILGSHEEWSKDPDNSPAATLIHRDRRTAFYGYVDIGVTHGQADHTTEYLHAALIEWRKMGAAGVLLDCAGPDYGVTRHRLKTVIAIAHHDGLRVRVNAFDPQALCDAGLRPGDGWLAENWVVAAGRDDRFTQGFDWPSVSVVLRHHIAVWMTATDSRPPSWMWVQTWVPQTARALKGSWIAVGGPQYSSQSNSVVPAAWIIQALHLPN